MYIYVLYIIHVIAVVMKLSSLSLLYLSISNIYEWHVIDNNFISVAVDDGSGG